jgi:hypothetical protein
MGLAAKEGLVAGDCVPEEVVSEHVMPTTAALP